jgi:hypothetical protein
MGVAPINTAYETVEILFLYCASVLVEAIINEGFVGFAPTLSTVKQILRSNLTSSASITGKRFERLQQVPKTCVLPLDDPAIN